MLGIGLALVLWHGLMLAEKGITPSTMVTTMLLHAASMAIFPRRSQRIGVTTLLLVVLAAASTTTSTVPGAIVFGAPLLVAAIVVLGQEQPVRLELHDRLGGGAQGDVYRATLHRPGTPPRTVAFKLLAAQQGADATREATLLSGLRHPNIIRMEEVIWHAGRPGFVLELVDGMSLRRLLALGALPERSAAEIARAVADAIAFGSRFQPPICHHDIKPDNIMVDRTGAVKLLDFGMAQLVGADGATGGTTAYMSPERSTPAPTSPASDVFALGCTLHEMLTRRLPPGDRTEPDLDGVSCDPRWKDILASCLDSDPGRRLAPMDLRRWLDRILLDLPGPTLDAVLAARERTERAKTD
ncbi:MAG: serine/threonine protein kinase [Alphaproteobacteria bacterium]|nr:serine/threonine protein kinase [Alphaproteobacteria bacterium]